MVITPEMCFGLKVSEDLQKTSSFNSPRELGPVDQSPLNNTFDDYLPSQHLPEALISVGLSKKMRNFVKDIDEALISQSIDSMSTAIRESYANSDYDVTAVGSEPLYGSSWTDYVASVMIDGEPFDVIIDTGSSSLAVASSPQAGCSRWYNPEISCDGPPLSMFYGSGNWTGRVCTPEHTVSIGGISAGRMRFAGIEIQTNMLQCSSHPHPGISVEAAQLLELEKEIEKCTKAKGISYQSCRKQAKKAHREEHSPSEPNISVIQWETKQIPGFSKSNTSSWGDSIFSSFFSGSSKATTTMKGSTKAIPHDLPPWTEFPHYLRQQTQIGILGLAYPSLLKKDTSLTAAAALALENSKKPVGSGGDVKSLPNRTTDPLNQSKELLTPASPTYMDSLFASLVKESHIEPVFSMQFCGWDASASRKSLHGAAKSIITEYKKNTISTANEDNDFSGVPTLSQVMQMVDVDTLSGSSSTPSSSSSSRLSYSSKPSKSSPSPKDLNDLPVPVPASPIHDRLLRSGLGGSRGSLDLGGVVPDHYSGRIQFVPITKKKFFETAMVDVVLEFPPLYRRSSNKGSGNGNGKGKGKEGKFDIARPAISVSAMDTYFSRFVARTEEGRERIKTISAFVSQSEILNQKNQKAGSVKYVDVDGDRVETWTSGLQFSPGRQPFVPPPLANATSVDEMKYSLLLSRNQTVTRLNSSQNGVSTDENEKVEIAPMLEKDKEGGDHDQGQRQGQAQPQDQPQDQARDQDIVDYFLDILSHAKDDALLPFKDPTHPRAQSGGNATISRVNPTVLQYISEISDNNGDPEELDAEKARTEFSYHTKKYTLMNAFSSSPSSTSTSTSTTPPILASNVVEADTSGIVIPSLRDKPEKETQHHMKPSESSLLKQASSITRASQAITSDLDAFLWSSPVIIDSGTGPIALLPELFASVVAITREVLDVALPVEFWTGRMCAPVAAITSKELLRQGVWPLEASDDMDGDVNGVDRSEENRFSLNLDHVWPTIKIRMLRDPSDAASELCEKEISRLYAIPSLQKTLREVYSKKKLTDNMTNADVEELLHQKVDKVVKNHHLTPSGGGEGDEGGDTAPYIAAISSCVLSHFHAVHGLNAENFYASLGKTEQLRYSSNSLKNQTQTRTSTQTSSPQTTISTVDLTIKPTTWMPFTPSLQCPSKKRPSPLFHRHSHSHGSERFSSDSDSDFSSETHTSTRPTTRTTTPPSNPIFSIDSLHTKEGMDEFSDFYGSNFCLLTPFPSINILGQAALEGTYTVFEVAKARVGFANAKNCDRHTKSQTTLKSSKLSGTPQTATAIELELESNAKSTMIMAEKQSKKRKKISVKKRDDDDSELDIDFELEIDKHVELPLLLTNQTNSTQLRPSKFSHIHRYLFGTPPLTPDYTFNWTVVIILFVLCLIFAILALVPAIEWIRTIRARHNGFEQIPLQEPRTRPHQHHVSRPLLRSNSLQSQSHPQSQSQSQSQSQLRSYRNYHTDDGL